jgi:hypothetical protein
MILPARHVSSTAARTRDVLNRRYAAACAAAVAVVGLAAVPAMAAQGTAAEEFLAVESRPGVKELLVLTPGPEGDAAKNVVLMLEGGSGIFGFASHDGKAEVQAAFPIAQRQKLADAVGATVVLSPPTDHPVMEVDWRKSSFDHVADLRVAVAVVKKRFPAANVWMMGISNGALSAAVAVEGVEGIAGAVLLSGSRDAYDRTRLHDSERVLAVHHRRDSCLTYADIRYNTGWRTFVLVDDDRQPRPGSTRKDCGLASAHLFAGKQDEVLEAVVQWILTGKTVDEIK